MAIQRSSMTSMRSKTAVLLAASVCLCAFFAAPAAAQHSFKKQVFENCDEAVGTFSALDREKRREQIVYLNRVLKLRSATVEDLVSVYGELHAPRGGAPDAIGGGNPFRTFEPKRDIEAKTCALRLIKVLGGDALPSIPDLVSIVVDPTVPRELRDSASEVMWGAAIAAGNESDSAAGRTVARKLLALTEGSSGYHAENLLVELRNSSLPVLIDALKSDDERIREKASIIALIIDPQGESSAALLAPLLSSPSPAVRYRALRLLRKMPQAKRLSLSAIITAMSDASPEIRELALKMDVKGDCQSSLMPNTELMRLLEVWGNVSGSSRQKIEETVESYAGCVDLGKFRERLSSEDAEVRNFAIRILGASRNGDPAIYSALLDALYDKALQVRIQAIQQLSNRTDHTAETLNAYLKLLKSAASDVQPRRREIITLAIAESANKLGSNKAFASAIPYFTEALGYLSSATTNVEPIVNAPVKLLLTLGSTAESHVVKELKRRDPIVRARAVHVLARLPQPNVKRARLVIAMLSDDSELVRKEVREGLPFLGKEAAPEVRKLLTSKAPVTRFNAAYALTLIQPDRSLLPLLKEGLKDSTCAVKVDLIPRLSGFDIGAEQESLLLKCVEASAADSPSAANALIAMSPLTNSVLDSLFDSMKQKRISKPATSAFVRELPKIAGSWDAAVPYFGNVLRDFDDELKLLALERVRTPEGARAPLLETIRNLTGDGIHPALRWQALVIMSLDSQPEAPEAIYRQLERDDFEWASGAIRYLPQSAGAGVIGKALIELNSERLALVIREVGFAGDKFKEYLPQIIALIDSEDQLVSYQAGITLIRLQPEHPKAPLALKRDLLGPYRNKLLDEDLPGVRQVAEKMLQASESYAERQALNALLTMRRADEQGSSTQ